MKNKLDRLFPVVLLAFFGVVFVQLGYSTLKRGTIKYIPQDGPAEILSPVHGATAFWALSAGMCVLGVLLLIVAGYILLRFFRGVTPDASNRMSSRRAFMSRTHGLWAILNLAFVLVALWIGYAEMAPERLVHANPDIIFCSVVFMTMLFFPFATVWYSLRVAGQTTLCRPSWRRFSIDWWHDPLQCLFSSCTLMGAATVGAALRLPGTSQTGFWMFVFFLCMFFGLLIGQLAVYAVYREHIQQT
jgi:hypothetical protein